MIWDGLILNDELDLLELRLMEIGDLVDRVVVCEAKQTFSGLKKPLHFALNARRFEQWKDKIAYVVPEVPSTPGFPHVEYAQRRAVADGWEDAEFDDHVMLSDVDEIPSRGVIEWLRDTKPSTAVVFRQELYYHRVNWASDQTWNGTIAMPKGFGRIDCQALRDTRNHLPPVHAGGWHFSWLGGADEIAAKLAAATVAADAAYYGSKIEVPDPADLDMLRGCADHGEDLFRRPGVKLRWCGVEPGTRHPANILSWLNSHPQYEVPNPSLRVVLT